MRLATFYTLLAISLLGTVLGFVYTLSMQERNNTITFVSKNLDQTIYRLEEGISDSLTLKRMDRVQKLVDKIAITDPIIKTISFSFDGKTIALSSNRSLAGSPSVQDVKPLAQMGPILIDHMHTEYIQPFSYLDQGLPKEGWLFISLDVPTLQESIFDISTVILYTLSIVITILGGIAVTIAYFMIIRPLKEITLLTQKPDLPLKKYLIVELNALQESIKNAFLHIFEQNEKLTKNYKKISHLDGILKTVADINALLITCQSLEELIQKSCNRLAGHNNYRMAWIGLVENHEFVLSLHSYDETNFFDGTHQVSLQPDDPSYIPFVAMALLENRSVIHTFKEDTGSKWSKRGMLSGFTGAIIIPLRKDSYSQPFGVLTVFATTSEPFETKEVEMIEELGGDIGFAIHAYRQNESLQHSLTFDAITQLPNRAMLLADLSQRTKPTLAVINIDRFKNINEVYGITIGDVALKIYGQWIKNFLEMWDYATLYKLSGDNFAILFDDHCPQSYAYEIIKKLITTTESETFGYNDIDIIIDITVGFAQSNERVLERAEVALNKAREQKRDFLAFDPSMLSQEDLQNNLMWYSRIKTAIKENKIIPYFQPIINNSTGEIEKYEALVRLELADGTIASPGAFLEIAKKTRLYPELTKIMVTKTILASEQTDLPVSINLSFEDIEDKKMREYLKQIVQSRRAGKRLIFEILESEGIESYNIVNDFITDFKALGCRFAIDDFGSGYSNFHHLLEMNIDFLKIDGSLIKNIPHDHNAQIIVQNIQNFAKEMNIKTVAEFVCNEDVYHVVKNIGIDASQGFYFYEPLPTFV